MLAIREFFWSAWPLFTLLQAPAREWVRGTAWGTVVGDLWPAVRGAAWGTVVGDLWPAVRGAAWAPVTG